MTEQRVYLAVSIVATLLAQQSVFIFLSNFRFARRKCAAALFACGVVTAAFCIWGCAWRGLSYPAWKFFSVLVPNALVASWLSRDHGVQFVVTYGYANLSVALVDLLLWLAGQALWPQALWLDLAVRVAGTALWACVQCRVVGRRYRRALIKLKTGWKLALCTVLALHALLYLLADSAQATADWQAELPLRMLSLCVMVLVLLLMLLLLDRSLDVQERQEAAGRMEDQLALTQKQFSTLSENINEVRRARHDMKYHIRVLHGLLENGEYEQARQYMEAYYSQLTALDARMPLYTRNKTVNVLVDYYVCKARENGITMEVEIHIPEQLPINVAHLSTLLGNLWQNALDACMTLPEGTPRYIETSMCVQDGRLVIRCKNSASTVVEEADGHFVTTKGEGHGVGLASIESIAEMYGGWCVCTAEGDTFSAAAVLELPEAV
jgi:signal transduction histidine kinase